MLRNYFLINVILFIILVFLGFSFYKVWFQPLDIPTQLTQQQPPADKKATVARKQLTIDEAAYNVIVKKDLFRPSRSAPPSEDASKVPSSKESPVLFGTVITADQKSAILEDRSTKTRKLYHINDSVAGFIISDIQEEKVILLRGDETIEVKLRDMKDIKPVVKKRPSRALRRRPKRDTIRKPSRRSADSPVTRSSPFARERKPADSAPERTNPFMPK